MSAQADQLEMWKQLVPCLCVLVVVIVTCIFLYRDSDNSPIQTTNETQSHSGDQNYAVNLIKRRIPGEKAKEMCKFYGKTTTTTLESPSLFIDSLPAVNLTKCNYHEKLIKGGEKAEEKEFPHMVSLGSLVGDGIQWKCGGSLVSEQFILSAAHCNKSNIYGHVGTIDRNISIGVLIKISNVYIHNDYDGRKNGDIALFKLSSKVTIQDNIRPICLDIGTFESTKWNKSVITTGWGVDENNKSQDVLQKVYLDIINKTDCAKKYEEIDNHTSNITISEHHICAVGNGKDSCEGDSGGPLQVLHPEQRCMYLLIGVTAFGKKCSMDTNFPGVYTNISSYVEWIENIVWPL